MANELSENNVSLSVHLKGKSSNSQLINLEDLSNLTAGIDGLVHHIVKTKIGKARTNEEVKRLCLLGISQLREGSAIIDISVRQNGQAKLGFSTKDILSEMIGIMNYADDKNLETVEKRVYPYLDLITKPLDSEKAKLELKLYIDKREVQSSKTFTVETRKRVQEEFRTFQIQSGILNGILTEVNFKNYSFQVQTFLKLEKIHFESKYAEKIISLLRKNVEVAFERESVKSKEKNLIEIKEAGIKLIDKKTMTAKDLLESGIIGKLSHRKDILDSVEYSKSLRNEVFR